MYTICVCVRVLCTSTEFFFCCNGVFSRCVLCFLVRLKSLIHHFAADHHHYGRWKWESVSRSKSHPFYFFVVASVVFLISTSTMHMNVFYICFFSAWSIEKRFFLQHPFNTLWHWRRLYRQWQVETWKNLDAVMRQRSTSTPSRDNQMGLSFLSFFFFSYSFSLCKHLSGYICILFRLVCTRNRREQGRERERKLFVPS